VLMGVAAWLVWRQGGFAAAALPLTLFLVQLGLNVVWSPLFFRWHLLGAAFADIILLWVAILATLLAFWRVSPTAGWLLLPYLLWVTYAAALNLAIWRMNT
jgi:benzodiazapine receptor